MNHYESDYLKKCRLQKWNNEHKAGGFRCSHCRQFVVINDSMGTANRNHCNICFWSKHVDQITGDRRSNCNGGMQPVGLTYKHEGRGKIGELMLIHCCLQCGKININRIARDDPEQSILDIFQSSLSLSQDARQQIDKQNIRLLNEDDALQVSIQLFGD